MKEADPFLTMNFKETVYQPHLRLRISAPEKSTNTGCKLLEPELGRLDCPCYMHHLLHALHSKDCPCYTHHLLHALHSKDCPCYTHHLLHALHSV
ncbi:hypothetical protein V6N12_046675 [Hibiscus sabdariffa]|uniref:Uncharacterized protein n=1 Tax=Hibiscus sabdariffa TaxID=183260 RepID=A0ABR2AR48_9ROSI